MYMVVAVALVWLATSLAVGVVWALATYRRPAPAVAGDPRPVLPDLPRPRAQQAARRRQHAGSR
ncbi:MAG: hypothetical protein ACLGIG_10295 [Actinomycetes bacterium]